MSKFDLQATYRRLVQRNRETMPHEEAMAHSIGSQFEAFGIIQSEMLRFYGLKPDGRLIDVGCGAGRTAIPLSRSHPGGYLGTDLVEDLVENARTKCARPDWSFQVVSGLTIPAEDQSADMVCMFSVLTHLLHEQSYLYLEEARRTLKPGGRVVFSFLEFLMPFHWAVFENTVQDARTGTDNPLNVFIERVAIQAWAEHLDMTVVDIRNGSEPFVPLAEPVTLDDGQVMEGFGNLGQSICVLERPA